MNKVHKIITASHSTIACGEQPLTGLDIGNTAPEFTIALVYAAPLNERRLIEGLRRTLDASPHFAGRLFGLGSKLPLVIPNNEGILLSCISFEGSIPVFDINHPLKPYLLKVVDPIQAAGFDHHTPLLQIHLTNFSDGCILGISLSHAFCDRASLFEFIRSLFASMTQTPLPPPCWNRRDVQQLALGNGEHAAREFPVLELERPPEPSYHPVETHVFHLEAPLLDPLLHRHDHDGLDPTRQDIAAAIIFQLMARCRTIPQETTSLTTTCDVRRILQLPSNYLGNATCLRHFELSAMQLDAADIGSLAAQIRHLHQEISSDGLRRDLAFWQRRMADGSAQRFIPLAAYLATQGGVLIDDMSKFDFYGLDFGAGQPAWVDMPAPSPAILSRSARILPASPGRDGFDLHITLPHEEMEKFQQSIPNSHQVDCCNHYS